MSTNYTVFQIISIFGSAAIGVMSIICFHVLKKPRAALFLLFAAATFIRFSIISYDPYLNFWDEQFHALVAKNMMKNPFMPMLYSDPVLPVYPGNWVSNSVWLHKPPLFLWQMAISMKIFGVNEFAMRLPSALMSVLTMLMIYSVARRWLNKYIAFYAALLFTFSAFMLDLVSGYNSTDHNDVAFIFYVTASFWAWSKYLMNKNCKLALLVGLAAGCAVLVKWLPGLLIFASWGAAILFSKNMRANGKIYLHFGMAFVCSLIVFLPWNIYAAYMFPVEYAITFTAKSGHIWNVVEGHSGGIFYHFHSMDKIYATGIKWMIVPALVLMMRRIRFHEIRTGAIVFIVLPFIVFSASATKMPAFTLISSLIVYIAIATLMYEVILFFRPRYARFKQTGKYFVAIILVLTLFWFYNVDSIQYKHTSWKKEIEFYRDQRRQSVKIFKFMNNQSNYAKNSVFVNCKQYDAVMMMFYTHFTAYDGVPDEIQMQYLERCGRPVYAFDNGAMDNFWEEYPFVTPIRHLRYWETVAEKE